MSIFFISDLHLGHHNCLSFDNRPFKSLDEQDSVIIKNWNSKVSTDDTVWILGDISWYNSSYTIELFNKLNGKKCLCIGNHDKKLLKNKQVRDLFDEITDYKELYLNKNTGVVLSHYPIPCYNKHFYGWYHLYGHVHNSFEWNMMEHDKYLMTELYGKKCQMYNVGAMIPYMGYTPRTLEEIIELEKF